jgi:flagellar hook assembly protein FlgD
VDKAQQEVIPDEVKLRPNYPNPFRRTTTIEYSLPSAQDVRLVVYDVLGRRVETIVDGRQEAGFHTLQWDGGRSLASGMYFARLVAGSTTKTERLVIIR